MTTDGYLISKYGLAKMKEDIILADNNDQIFLNAWENIFVKFHTNKSYTLTHLMSRKCSSDKAVSPLSRSFSTKVIEIELDCTISSFIINTIKNIEVTNFRAVHNVNINLDCNNCNAEIDFSLATSGKIRCANCNVKYRLSDLQRKMDADVEVDFDGELQKVVIEDLLLRKLLTMQQIDTTNATQNIIEDTRLDIDAIMFLKIK